MSCEAHKDSRTAPALVRAHALYLLLAQTVQIQTIMCVFTASFPISIQAYAAGPSAAAADMPQWILIQFDAARVRAVRLHWADVWGYRLTHPAGLIGETSPCIDSYRVLAQSWKQLGAWDPPAPEAANTQAAQQQPFVYHGNDGSVTCSAFCSSDWRGELRASGWRGACCKAAYKVNANGAQKCGKAINLCLAAHQLKCVCRYPRKEHHQWQTVSVYANSVAG